MTGYYDRGKRWYRCSRNKDVKACRNRVNADWIEGKAWEVVQLLLELDRPFLDVELRRRSEFTSTYRESDLQPVRSAISQKSTELQRLETAYLSGAFELPRFMELKSSIASELQQLQKVESQILDDLDRQHSRDRDIDAAAEFVTRIRNEVAEYAATQRQQLIEALNVRLIYQDREHWRSTFWLPAEYGLDPAEVFGGVDNVSSPGTDLSLRTRRRW